MKSRSHILTLAALTGLALAAGTAHAGVWASSSWNDDTDLTNYLSTSTTYTHAIDFTPGIAGSEVSTTIAGVNFTQFGGVSWQNFARNGTHLATGNGWSYTANYFYGGVFPGGPSGTESAILSTGMLMAGPSAQGTETLTLSGLNPNTDYVFTLFNPNYDSNVRTVDLDGDDDGVGNIRATTGDNTFVSYAYNTGASTSFSMDFIGTSTPSEYEFPAFTNEAVAAVPEPSTTALLGLGGLALLRRRRK